MSGKILATSNLLLSRLDREASALLGAHLTRIEFHRERSFSVPGEPVETVYFPEGGIVSCVVANDRDSTEVAIIGKEGVTGIGALLGDHTSRIHTYVQVNHSTALAIDTAVLRGAMEANSALRQLILRYAQYTLLQSTYTTVTVSKYLLEARLARWLLMCHDRVEGSDIHLTHEFMGMMISAQRSGVTIALHSLEGEAMIKSTRGKVTIRDRAKLLELAGGSYGAPEQAYRELIGPFGKTET